MSYLSKVIEHLNQAGLLTKEISKSLAEFNQINKKEIEDIGDDCFRFGKYKKKKIGDIAKIDIDYLKWVYKQNWCRDTLKEQLNEFLKN